MHAYLLTLVIAASAPQGPTSLGRLDDLAAVRRLTAPAGRPRLVHFWATWCQSCMDELPRQLVAAARAKARGVDDVVFVNVDGYGAVSEVRDHLSRLEGAASARHVQLNMELELDDVTALFDPHWRGTIPATFGLAPNGAVTSILGSASEPALDAFIAELTRAAGQTLTHGDRTSPGRKPRSALEAR